MVSAFVNFAARRRRACSASASPSAGLHRALLKQVMLAVPPALLTPTWSSSASVVDGPRRRLRRAARGGALYRSAGRSPRGPRRRVRGVAGGFGANLFVTSLDPLLAELDEGAGLIDPDSRSRQRELWFMIARRHADGRRLGVTARGRGLRRSPVERRTPAATVAAAEHALRPRSAGRSPGHSGGAIGIVVLSRVGAPLHGATFSALGRSFRCSSWASLPGVVTGPAPACSERPRRAALMSEHVRDGLARRALAGSSSSSAYSNLGRCLPSRAAALAEAARCRRADDRVHRLVGSTCSSARCRPSTLLAPVFVPMFAQTGISPELTQIAYRIGDRSNVITLPTPT